MRGQGIGPGGLVALRPITPEHRAERGVVTAWEETVRQLANEYLEVVEGWEGFADQPTFNLILTIEKPDLMHRLRDAHGGSATIVR
jgi:hypothetical protein